MLVLSPELPRDFPEALCLHPSIGQGSSGRGAEPIRSPYLLVARGLQRA